MKTIKSLACAAALLFSLALTPEANPIRIEPETYGQMWDRDDKWFPPMVTGSMCVVVVGNYTAPTPAPDPTYLGTNSDTANKTGPDTYTFAGSALGTAHAQRVIVLNVAIGGVGSDYTITIGGISTTLVQREATSAAQMHYAAVPTGTTGTIAVSFASGSGTRCWISWYNIYPKEPVPYGSAQSGIRSAALDAIIPQCNVPKNGYLIYFGSQGGTVGAFGTTWDGTNTLTEDVDAQIEAAASYTSGHVFADGTKEAAPRTITMAETVSGNKNLYVATWIGDDATDTPSLVLNTAPAIDTSNASTYTFTNADVGTADATRVVVVQVHVRMAAAQTWVSSTIGGITAYLLEERTGTEHYIFTIAAPVPTGTTATIVVTFSGLIGSSCGVEVHSYSLYSTQAYWPGCHTNVAATGTTDLSVPVTAPKDSIVLYGETSDEPAITHTWSSATEDYDGQMGAISSSRAGAHYSVSSGGTFTETVSESSTSGRRLTMVVYR